MLTDDLVTPEDHAKATIDVGFLDINWEFIQSVYGWSALQYQAWARGYLQISGRGSQTVVLFTDGLLELWVDNHQYFGGDFYTYRRSPIVLDLSLGSHVIDLRLIRDVRSHGGGPGNHPRVRVCVEAHLAAKQLAVDAGSLIVPEVVEGRLSSPLASINVRNDMAEWLEIMWIKSIGVSDVKLTSQLPVCTSVWKLNH